METTRKIFVEFIYPGVFFNEYSTEEVVSRDPHAVKVPDRAFGFRFFDIVEATDDDGLTLKSDRLNQSGIYYVGGRVLTLEEVKAEMPGEQTLIGNMERNGWDRIIQTKFGTRPFTENDIHLAN